MTRPGAIVVTGATGTIGRTVVELLAAESGVTIRAATRHPEQRRPADHVTWTQFDWEAPDTVDSIMVDAETLLVLPPPARHPLRTTKRLLEQAVAAGVGHVVFLSTLGAEFDPGFAFGRWARTGEQAVAHSGLGYTVLRPNSFMTNFLTTQRPDTDGALRLPWRTGATSFVDSRDVAAVTARVLLEPHRHVGATYELTGSEALGVDAVAALLRDAAGEPIHYIDTPPDETRTKLSDRGMPPPMVTAFMELHAVMASGARNVVTDDVEHVTGQPPRSFAAFASEYAAAWTQPARASSNGTAP